MRLQQYLAHAGIASRRKCEALILEGRVKVNGSVAKELGTTVEPGRDTVTFDGKDVRFERKLTYCFYKPPHVMCTADDPEGRQTVHDYFRDVPERLYNVGRLDFDSEGVLLMTNDGDLANALTHPSKQIDKVYFAVCDGLVAPEALEALRRGVVIDGRKTAPAKVSALKLDASGSTLLIRIHEGRNRQIRKMLDVVGHPVRYLRREQFATLTIEGLKPGKYRLIEGEELRKLRDLAGLKS